jgi:transcriptional regulator with GAF, ATPase, and Fis domain
MPSPPRRANQDESQYPIEREIVASCPAMKDLLRRARRVAPTRLAVLLHGPSGTGKESIARLVHEASGRSGAFVAINCACLTPDLADSELFGHEKGAFTGAMGPHAGLFAAAEGGTLFLDEVGELDLRVQARLLRVLQEGRYRRVGSIHERTVNVRIVCATNRDLEAMSRNGRFREDLYWRVAQYELVLPPLRERGEDVIVIAQRLLDTDPLFGGQHYELSRGARRLLLQHTWPGNVRELQRVLRTLAIDGCSRVVQAQDIARTLRKNGEEGVAEKSAPEELILGCLEKGGELSPANLARQLGISRPTLFRWLQPLLESGRVRQSGGGAQVAYSIYEE